MPIEENKFKADLAARFIKLMDSERGIQTNLAKSVNKPASFFSGIKQGKPVNALHLKAAGIVFGPLKLLELLAIGELDPGGQEGGSNNTIPIVDRRITPQNPREGIISLFQDRETARQMNLDMVEIEKLDHDQYLMLIGEIRGTARALKPKKKA